MEQRLVRRFAIALGVVAALLAVLRRRIRRRARLRMDESAGVSRSIEPAPLVVIRGAFDDVTVCEAGDDRIEISSFGDGDVSDAVRVSRAEDGSRVVLDMFPRRKVDVFVPHGTTVRLNVARSRGAVYGLDDVDVRCARSVIGLHDVAGTIRVRSARAEVDVDLARDRETRAVKASVARTRFALALPAARGGTFRVRTAKSRVEMPPSVDGGIPVAVRAARAEIAIRAA